MPFPVMLMAAVMAQRRTQVQERLWQLDAMRTRCHHKGQTSPQGGDPSHQGDDHVVSPSPRFPSLLFLSSPRAICSVLFPSCKPPRRTARYTHRGPKEGIRGLPRPSSQVLQSCLGPGHAVSLSFHSPAINTRPRQCWPVGFWRLYPQTLLAVYLPTMCSYHISGLFWLRPRKTSHRTPLGGRKFSGTAPSEGWTWLAAGYICPSAV